MQSVLSLVYPPQCAVCDTETNANGGLCGPCWRDMPFIHGPACDACGLPLPGDRAEEGILCDACLVTPRAWDHGRAAFLYSGTGRRLVMALKHNDRLDLVEPAARLLADAAEGILRADSVAVPVPCHWTRRVTRRYNQAALLAQALARAKGIDYVPRALVRHRRTASLGKAGRSDRFAELDGAIRPDPIRGHLISGRPVLVVDDVHASGATLAATATACRLAGASRVDVVTLARAGMPA